MAWGAAAGSRGEAIRVKEVGEGSPRIFFALPMVFRIAIFVEGRSRTAPTQDGVEMS
jgi:hypothetical protein